MPELTKKLKRSKKYRDVTESMVWNDVRNDKRLWLHPSLKVRKHKKGSSTTTGDFGMLVVAMAGASFISPWLGIIVGIIACCVLVSTLADVPGFRKKGEESEPTPALRLRSGQAAGAEDTLRGSANALAFIIPIEGFELFPWPLKVFFMILYSVPIVMILGLLCYFRIKERLFFLRYRKLCRELGKDTKKGTERAIIGENEGINLWEDPDIGPRLHEVAKDLVETGLRHFKKLQREEFPDRLKLPFLLEPDVRIYQHRNGLQIIRKPANLGNIDDIREFWMSEHPWCCPTFLLVAFFLSLTCKQGIITNLICYPWIIYLLQMRLTRTNSLSRYECASDKQ
ncbi:MAG: hypothetical protein ACE5JK_03955 [Candidatus Omnitrophota bacterium]